MSLALSDKPGWLASIDAAEHALAQVERIDDAADMIAAAETAKVLARNARLGREAANHAAHVSLLCQRRAGELLAEMPKAPPGRPVENPSHDGRDSDPPTLAEIGVSHNESSRWQNLAAIPAEKFDKAVEQIKGAGDELTTAGLIRTVNGAHVGNNSGENEWYTPAEYIDAARRVMGGIDLDPASSAAANEVIKASTFYTATDNGLTRKWEGRVWMNPPYSQPLIGEFCDKLVAEYDYGRVTQAIVLSNNATETRWFQTLADAATAVCFPAGRIRYWYPGRPSLTPLQGQVFVYLGAYDAAFKEAFSEHGVVF